MNRKAESRTIGFYRSVLFLAGTAVLIVLAIYLNVWRGVRTSQLSESTPAPAPREGEWVTYAAADDRYTISFPAGYEMLENETVSVDGVTHPAPNTLTLVADNDSTADFVLTIQHAQYAGETSLEAALQIGVGEDSCYFAVPENSEPITIGGQEALIFRDTPCGPFGSTLIYTVAGEMIFLITIESSASFGMIEEEIRPILDTFEVS